MKLTRAQRRKVEHSRRQAGGVVAVLHIEIWKDGTVVRNAGAADAMQLAVLSDESKLALKELWEQNASELADRPVMTASTEGPDTDLIPGPCRMDAANGPECFCGAPSNYESGLCVEHGRHERTAL